jgi:hypothetical protein
MAFNIYEWRRNQLLTENRNSDGMEDYNKQMLKQLLDWYKSQDDADPAMINKLESQIGGINEGKITVKSIKFSDLGDKNLLPTNIGMGSSKKIKDEEDFKAWKADFLKKYGNIELEKGNAGWKASPEHEANKQAQADFDKNAKKK